MGKDIGLKNAPSKGPSGIVKDSPSEDGTAPHGTVSREFNFRDRDLIISACREYVASNGKGGHKSQAKLDRVIKELNLEELTEYFDMIQDSVEDESFKWGRLRNNWLSYQQYLAGGMSAQELKVKVPDIDLSSPPKKPPMRQPQPTPEELRGKSRVFHLTSKLDVWIIEAVKAANWTQLSGNPSLPEYVSELCKKLGICIEDD